MSLKIHKHFDFATPFHAAENDDELAEIMRLKYPRACSSLETGAEFFARMVEDVRKFEAWRVIGFASFEEFCREKLGRTITEVEEIVEGVKLLGGNPTEAEAKKAAIASRQREMKAENPDMSFSEIAKQTGTTRQAAHKACQPKAVLAPKELTTKPPMLRLTKDPAKTARNIINKMGLEYALKLSAEITTI
jgi:predicted DNA-binding protein YlxM (UPF0122 family)